MKKASENELPGRYTGPGEVVFVRRLPGAIERAWAWLTEPEKRARWLAGGPMELRVGGRVELHFNHSSLTTADDPVSPKYQAMCSGPITMVGQVTRCEPPRLLAYTWGEEDGKFSEVTFELTPEGDDVRLVLHHRKLGDDPAQLAGVGAGWHTHVAIMLAHLAGETPPRFWATHARLELDYAGRLAAGEGARPLSPA